MKNFKLLLKLKCYNLSKIYSLKLQNLNRNIELVGWNVSSTPKKPPTAVTFFVFAI